MVSVLKIRVANFFLQRLDGFCYKFFHFSATSNFYCNEVSISKALHFFSVVDDVSPINLSFKHWTYVTSICEYMYHQGLLDRQDFLQWLVDQLEKCRAPDDPLIRLILALILQYCKEIVKSEVLSRKLAYQCARKITHLVHDTEAMSSSNNGSSGNAENPGQHPIITAFIELMDDSYTRFIILSLSSVIQMVTLECPTALVWNYFGENKSPTSLLGSPLDFLPNCAPSGLPMPPGQNNQAIRHRIRQAETMIKERSAAAEGKLFYNNL